jgi:hypothetical protein
MEDVGIFYGHLVYFVAICYISWLFGTFPPFWLYTEKSGTPAPDHGMPDARVTRLGEVWPV